MSNEHPAHEALYSAFSYAGRYYPADFEKIVNAEDFVNIDHYVNVVVMVHAVYECPSNHRERPYVYIVLDDGAGPRVAITGDNGVPALLRYANDGQLPALMWLRHYECDHGGYRRYWNRAPKSAVPGQVMKNKERRSALVFTLPAGMV
jgi:hypothetical protein